LIRLEDLRGDLHSHTVASDGHETIEGMVEAARAVGYRYLAITDHSASHGFGNDVQPRDLLRQTERIHAINADLKGFELLSGTETSIGTDGRPDYTDKVLAELDWVIASVHSSFRLSHKAMTERMVAAVEHPLVDAI